MNFTKAINSSWCDYDQVVGQNQLINFGVIFLDNYGCPIDNEYELDELYDKWMRR